MVITHVSYTLDSPFTQIGRLSNAILLLVGDGPLRAQTEEKARILGIKDKIIFTGVRNDVSELMQAMDVLVFPSKNEGLPVTLVEAQTAGLPCIISDCIPKDSIITKGLVDSESLQKPACDWAKLVLARKGEERTDRSQEIRQAGFDIQDTAKWMEAFYLEKSKRQYSFNSFYASI